MAAECLSFGVWVEVYKGLTRRDSKLIATEFGLHFDDMSSFTHSLSVLRNVCAHHARVFDRSHTHASNVAGKLKGVVSAGDNTFYSRAATLHVFLNRILPVNHWPQKLVACFNKHPGVNPTIMGFLPGWESLPFWQATGVPVTSLVSS
ncbi:MAG: Abi family protein [Pseudomonadales bacterium]|nr:Abi family protein [Pseudomonadales bacterium]